MPTPPVPQHCPTPVELDDLELLASGAPRRPDAFNQPGSPVTLDLPEPVARPGALASGAVELVDPEGLPLARVSWPGGVVDPLTHAQFGPFREPDAHAGAYRAAYAGRTVVPVTDALTDRASSRSWRGLGPVDPARAGRHRHPVRCRRWPWSAPPAPPPACSPTRSW